MHSLNIFGDSQSLTLYLISLRKNLRESRNGKKCCHENNNKDDRIKLVTDKTRVKRTNKKQLANKICDNKI